jgi:hypothetical protein
MWDIPTPVYLKVLTTNLGKIPKVRNIEKGIIKYQQKKWKPQTDIFLVGCRFLLLTCTSNQFELYASISPEPFKLKGGEKTRFFMEIKTETPYFYAQRDQRAPPASPYDIIYEKWLPSGLGFPVSKNEPIYFKTIVMSKSSHPTAFDITCHLFYVQWMSSTKWKT